MLPEQASFKSRALIANTAAATAAAAATANWLSGAELALSCQ